MARRKEQFKLINFVQGFKVQKKVLDFTHNQQKATESFLDQRVN